MDVLYHVGRLIYQRSLRYTIFTVGVSVIGVVAREGFDLPGLTIRQAILLPLLVGVATLVGGFVMKAVPRLISSRLLTVAQASDLNLMEDYRKSQADEHLRVLWQRLFQHECGLHIEPGGDSLPAARSDFLARAHKALITPEPQIRQMHEVGLDLRYLEDWRDGAYLDRSDTKLVEQFEGNMTLLAARRQAGLYGPATMWRFRARRGAQKFWSALLTRMVAIRVAGAIERLNRRYDTDLFNSQVLLWPGEQDAGWLGAMDGARDAVMGLRAEVIRRVFGPDLDTADGVLDRMLYTPFALATELRMRYDPEYCDGRLGYDVTTDLEAEGTNRRDLQRARAFVRSSLSDMDALGEFLHSHRPRLLDGEDPAALRAVRIAFHVRRGDLKRRLLRRAAENPDDLVSRIDRVVADKQTWSRRLVAVRMHHELARLARCGYRDLLEALAYAESP